MSLIVAARFQTFDEASEATQRLRLEGFDEGEIHTFIERALVRRLRLDGQRHLLVARQPPQVGVQALVARLHLAGKGANLGAGRAFAGQPGRLHLECVGRRGRLQEMAVGR